MLTVKNLSFAYWSKTAVDNMSFDIKSAEVIGILGTNGAGNLLPLQRYLGLNLKKQQPPVSSGDCCFSLKVLFRALQYYKSIVSPPVTP